MKNVPPEDAKAYNNGLKRLRRSSIHERFWRLVLVCGPDMCWPWLACRNKAGYGTFGIHEKDNVKSGSKRSHLSSRVSYWLMNGVWPVAALHTCDNPACCNPRHIFSGTRKDNFIDMKIKGRHTQATGTDYPQAKLTDNIVSQIRHEVKSCGASCQDIARRMGLNASTIYDAVSSRTWAHVK